MEAVKQLISYKYKLETRKGRIRYKYLGLEGKEPSEAKALLKQIKQRKDEAMEYLIIEQAKSKTASEWKKLRDKATDDNEWIRLNAFKRLREALDKDRKSDTETWAWIAKCL